MKIDLNSENFKSEVYESVKPVLVDFWATWCPPCKMLNPILEELATELDSEVKIGKVDVDANPGLAEQFKTNSIPTIILFKDGKEVKRLTGAYPKEKVISFIRNP